METVHHVLMDLTGTWEQYQLLLLHQLVRLVLLFVLIVHGTFRLEQENVMTVKMDSSIMKLLETVSVNAIVQTYMLLVKCFLDQIMLLS